MDILRYAVMAALAGTLGLFLSSQAGGGNALLLTDLLAVPLTGAFMVMAMPPRWARFTKHVAAFFAFTCLSVCAVAAWNFNPAPEADAFQFAEQAPWIGSMGISFSLAVDGIGLAMVMLTGIVIFTGVLASWKVVERPKEYFALLLILVTGVFGVFMARDLFLFFLFYELAVLPMYLLIGIWGTGRKEYAAMKLTLYLLFGSALILVGILAMYFTAVGPGRPPTFDMAALSSAGFTRDFQSFYFPFLFLGFGILAGFWPLHTWSPDGHASAPTAVSMLHAGVLMKLGAYGIIRIAVEMMPDGARAWLPFFGVFTVINITYGAMVAMAQTDLKYVVAYSSVSHMGIVLLGICSMNDAGINGAVLQMFSHGIMTALFFALVGFTYEKTHTRQIAEYGGLGARMPALATFFTIGGLASLGLPGLSGFVAEFMVFLGAWRFSPAITVVAAAGVVITAAYVLRVLQKCFWGPLNPAHSAVPDASPVELVCLSILSFFLVFVGLMPGPLVALINSGVVRVLARLGGGS
jgi:NADH-quinone oxidoreductase subunit M